VKSALVSVDRNSGAGISAWLVEQALALRVDNLSADALMVARGCVTDWLACSFAGLNEPVATILAASIAEEGGKQQATLIGKNEPGTLLQAALYNGALSHALDYDDVNLAVPGHMSAAILPAVIALAEYRGASGEQLLTAFASGYEAACQIGRLVEPAHYTNGFHATATIGGIGASIACARLLGLTAEQTCHAVGIAATQSAGLKAMFGSMTKPLHAGLAAQAGMRAALYAKRGMCSRTDSIECDLGFARTHGGDFNIEAALSEPKGQWHLTHNLFKFHAACYSTHSTIEAVTILRQANKLTPDSVESISVLAGEGCSICNIQQPTTGLEAKFSLRVAAAFALLDIDTSDLHSWNRVTQPAVESIRQRVQVKLVAGMSLSESLVSMKVTDGRRLEQHFDCGKPSPDKHAENRKLRSKFKALVTPVAGSHKTLALLDVLGKLEQQSNLGQMLKLCQVE
jgi:2-methylcitrate dehydratase PrpD